MRPADESLTSGGPGRLVRFALFWKPTVQLANQHKTRAKRLRMRKVSIFKMVVANANFKTRTPFLELKSNFISIQNFKAGNVKPPGIHWSKDF